MKQVININFHGRVVPIEVTAYEMVKNYIESLKKHFASEEGGDEIINDIEGRVGELFQEKIKSGASCITDADVDAVIASIGRPEQFDTEEAKNAGENTAGQTRSSEIPRPRKLYRNEAEKLLGGVCSGLADYLNIDVVIVRIVSLIFLGPLFLPYIIMWIVLPGSSTQSVGARTKKLFRDPDEKLIAGVCSGLGKYFGVDAWIPRIIFLLPLLGPLFNWNENLFLFTNVFKLTLSPGAFTIYLILWLVIPKAKTASEKLQMRGEKVDLNTLQSKFSQGAKDFEQKAEKWGKEFSGTMQERAQSMKSEAIEMAGKGKGGIGRVFGAIIKAIVYIILGFAAFIAFIIVMSLAIAALAAFPLRDFVINGGWQNTLAWTTMALLLILPLAGAVIWIIRRIIRTRSHSRALRISFATLWFIGILTGGILTASVASEFNSRAKTGKKEVQLSNPSAQTLRIIPGPRMNKFILSGRNNNISPEDLFYLDSFHFDNVKFRTLESDDDSFRVFMYTSSYGRNSIDAENRAMSLNPAFVSYDSTLVIDPGIIITRKAKFRNQQLHIDIYVPKGKKAIVDEDFNNVEINTFRDDEAIPEPENVL